MSTSSHDLLLSSSAPRSPYDSSILGLARTHSSTPTHRGHELTGKEILNLSGRSRSPVRSPIQRGFGTLNRGGGGDETPPNSPPSRWWYGKGVTDSSQVDRRPWRDQPQRRKKTIPEEQSEGWEHTRQRVAKAAASVLGTTGDILHETLVMTADVLDFAPVPGLAVVAHRLLEIWDALQAVDMNRLACLRLTERCANILISVRQEIHEAGDSVGEDLAAPIAKLDESFDLVRFFLQKQIKRPFIKRYLKRDEILGQIRQCDAMLTEALGMFSISIQIRILRQVQESERNRDRDARVFLDSLKGALQPKSITVVPTLGPTFPSADVLPALRAILDQQNAKDAEMDLEDLTSMIRACLAATTDLDVLNTLQVDRDDMPEAIKTLQRALERVVEQQGAAEYQEQVERTGKLGRRKKSMKKESLSDNGSRSGEEGGGRRDTLHREFLESGIDALKRMSKGLYTSLPSWTITRYEVDREEKIGIGFFSDVYRGTWRGQVVAIKVLAETTPRELFRREVEIWKQLKHDNVLELYGASSTSGDPPWFFVSPYYKNGCLVQFLKHIAPQNDWRFASESDLGTHSSNSKAMMLGVRGRTVTAPNGKPELGNPSTLGSRHNNIRDIGQSAITREEDLYRLMLEIARGMAYLHANGVLHGDLKAANVLVDDKLRCVISDFGQSQMKSEVYRISQAPFPCGTLRWQAPELMSGASQLSLTPQMDVYSYAILCIEILGMGKIPWPLMDDEAVRYLVLGDNERPPIPRSRFDTPTLRELLRVCWNNDPDLRPTFDKIVEDIYALRKTFAASDTLRGQAPSGKDPSPHSPARTLMEQETPKVSSPNMWPSPLSPNETTEVMSMQTEDTLEPRVETIVPDCSSESLGRGLFTPSTSRSSSVRLSTPSSQGVLDDLGLDLRGLGDEPDGYRSPLPMDSKMAMLKDERRYRLLLEHSFHPSLTLPLWSPSSVDLGAVGYLSKPSGSFVTLFNSLFPEKADNERARGLPSLFGYGKVITGEQRVDKRNVAQRGLDAIVGWFRVLGKGGNDERSVARRYSYPLRAGHKAAHLCTETTLYRYIERLEVPKKWFKANVNAIMQIYGAANNIHKEDLYLVIGTLNTPDYALFVSHNHPDGHAHFSVYSAPRKGQEWGVFTTDAEVKGGPSYQEPDLVPLISRCNVSKTDDGLWNTVLIAKLRFKPDAPDPTSL